ncbi:DsbA family protein [Rathayibacter toxicus]|uniref:DSBA oxidoreductase n=1 Tax=Rathayibacter toxicus TaxID=145458 RepID=A0A0C5B9U8_9MICO|nr:DsbA family protein [Rathayibacter toxicus]AJM77608.1 DSBA oxidoreductase [Rathayibacter toxicus]ALS56458.1 disulfide bond formation protein DsbA [Rathayibacter toxicus]KKM44566.1 DSBA oxidoreductase [Rathayibacter toxicus]PPG21724.1 disulfide bond formation protein DsbA [Rathayibacter toxicus]PPG46686.1 disulfide bond formation protein DsbA [Rathayibacter toxicus]
MTTVDFWFDPSCPWAWLTSRFVDEVTAARELDVRWHIFSLTVLNEDKDIDEEHRVVFARALRYTRLVTAVVEREGRQHVKPLYDALGTRIHRAGRSDSDLIMAESLADLVLPADLVQFADSEVYDGPLRASHLDAIHRVGQDVGTPVIAIGDVAFFGPVISPTPRGEQALTLWDGIVMAASYDGFFELKRSRSREPQFE